MYYARYRTYYAKVLKYMEEFSPGNKEILLNSCTSVQTQERHPTRTAVGMQSEKTSNREAKTPGGITNFSTKQTPVYKW